MAVFLVTLLVMLFVVSGMSVGVMMGRKPLAGSCGGVGKALGEDNYVCDLCGGDEAKCDSLQQEQPIAAELGVNAADATKKSNS